MGGSPTQDCLMWAVRQFALSPTGVRGSHTGQEDLLMLMWQSIRATHSSALATEPPFTPYL